MPRCDENPQKPAVWQHYLISEMQAVDVLPDKFDGGRADDWFTINGTASFRLNTLLRQGQLRLTQLSVTT
jgi:hypothetical protein